MTKGIIGLPPIVIKGAFVAIVVLGILGAGSNSINTFVKQEALDINANRLSTTALTMNSAENISFDMDMADFQIKQEETNLSMRYGDETTTVKLEEETGFEHLEAPQEWKKIENGYMCMNKLEDSTLNISTGEC